MDSEILATNILNSLINKNVKDVSKYLVFPNSDKITNAVRKQLNNLSTNELKSIQLFLKVSPGNSYDLLIRSWTLAFFSNSKTPYSYQDIHNDDWSKAKVPRLKRLSINSEANSKFLKAMSFRSLDLLVLYLFLENRKTDILTKEESDIVSNAFIEYPKFSKTKIQFLKSLKEKLGAKYSS